MYKKRLAMITNNAPTYNELLFQDIETIPQTIGSPRDLQKAYAELYKRTFELGE